MKRSYKYRLYPNKEQAATLRNNFAFCCFLYNCALQERNVFYKRYGTGRSYIDQCRELPEIKKEFSTETASLYSQTLQQVLKKLDQSYKNFFRRVKAKASEAGFPRFKSFDRFNSIVFPQSDLKSGGVKLLDNNKLQVFGIPGQLKVTWHRPFQGRCKQVMIKKQGDKFYLILSCDAVSTEILNPTGKTVSLDLGLNSFITADDGTSFHHPKPYKTAKEKLAFLNRKLALKQKGSNNRQRAKRSLARMYDKISNIRNDFLHKVAKQLITENDTIIIEKLNVKSMLEAEPKKSAEQTFQVAPKKSNIQDASWARFASLLIYKAESAGRSLIEVDSKNTSKMCSQCSHIKLDQTLKDRKYICEACGFACDRDLNAAYNIRNKGLGTSPAIEKSISEAPIL